jgi:hypothetical protein
MRWFLLPLLLAGCTRAPLLPRGDDEAEKFGPSELAFHSFTTIKDWTSDQKPDGIEAVVEFLDQFGDPTKASGTLIFELYEYRRAAPDPRGQRLMYWNASIQSLQEQRLRWNRISRTYSFALANDQINPRRTYVLSAIFQSSSGGRLFSRTILEPQPEEPSASQPSTRPSATAPALP